MKPRLCQLKTLMILLTLCTSCSWFKERKIRGDEELLTMIQDRREVGGDPEYVWETVSGEKQSHLFFDIQNSFSKASPLMNVVVLNPAGSKNQYKLDLQSGQRYFDHEWCETKDAWKKYSGSLDKIPFSVGVIPGALDLLGEPQQVLIFGGAKKYESLQDQNYFQVRLLGSVIQQICVEGNCLGKKNWPSRLIHLAVDPEDREFGSIKDLQTLKTKINFPEIKAFIENHQGINTAGSKEFPAASIGDFIDFESTFNFQKKYALHITGEEREKMVKSCHAIYDKAWRDVGLKTIFDLPSQTTEELKEKIKVRAEWKKARIPVEFHERFRAYTLEYATHFVTCMKFVRFPSVNIESEKFWFLSDIGIYYLLHDDGHYFDCLRKSWTRNTLNNRGELVYKLKDGIYDCSTKDLDASFNYLGSYLMGLRNSAKFYYRFLDYDSHPHGTHAKVYSWIKYRKFESSCTSKVNEQILRKSQLTPADHKWSPRHQQDGKSSDLDIIL
ncbi:MAG: hypothetical protein ACOVP4_10460 [Bacteriovoracaceae bacterium]